MAPSTIIALVSFLLSVATFIFVYLRPPKTSTSLGPTVSVGYTNEGSGFSVSLPVTFINSGAKADSVFRTAILIHHQNWPNERYFIQWNSFVKLDNTQITLRWIHEELAHALMIPANSSVNRVILFNWPPTEIHKLKIREGLYVLEFFFWINDTTLPRYETHQILFSKDDLAILEDMSNPKNLRSVYLQLDQQLKTTRFIESEFDARAVRKQRLKKEA